MFPITGILVDYIRNDYTNAAMRLFSMIPILYIWLKKQNIRLKIIHIRPNTS